MTKYGIRCPRCFQYDIDAMIPESELWPGSYGAPCRAAYPDDPSEPQQCGFCGGWWRIVLVGPHHEVKAEPCESLWPDPPEILGMAL